MEYLIPKSDAIFEEEIKKSRFITYLRHTEGLTEAKAFLSDIKAQHPQARHWCWATVSGSPQDSQQYGFSDDGEPSGTAGKPMLNYLLGSGYGELTAVVVRYYGGIQLGTGGLVKAYGGGVKNALALLETERKVQRTTFHLSCEYDQFKSVQHILADFDIEILDQQFAAQVELQLAIPPKEIEAMQAAFTERFAGKLRLQKVE